MSITNHKTKIDIQLHDMLYQQRKFEIALKYSLNFESDIFYRMFFLNFMWNIVHDLREINNNKYYIYISDDLWKEIIFIIIEVFNH